MSFRLHAKLEILVYLLDNSIILYTAWYHNYCVIQIMYYTKFNHLVYKLDHVYNFFNNVYAP